MIHGNTIHFDIRETPDLGPLPPLKTKSFPVRVLGSDNMAPLDIIRNCNPYRDRLALERQRQYHATLHLGFHVSIMILNYLIYTIQLSTINHLNARRWLPKRSLSRKRHFRSNRPPRTNPNINLIQQPHESLPIVQWICITPRPGVGELLIPIWGFTSNMQNHLIR
jgi:hypothetical protein